MSHVASLPVHMPSMVVGPHTNAVSRRIARMRGTVLCVFSSDHSLPLLEQTLSRSGLTLLRAQHDLHALILARASRPDLIVVDVPQPADPDRAILAQLRRQPITAAIPLLVLVPTLQQRTVERSTLRYASATMLRNASLESILAEIRQLLTPADSWNHRVDPSVASIDAVFSEFGTRHYRHAARRAPQHSSLTEQPSELRPTDPDQPIHKVNSAHSLPAVEHMRSMGATAANGTRATNGSPVVLGSHGAHGGTWTASS